MAKEGVERARDAVGGVRGAGGRARGNDEGTFGDTVTPGEACRRLGLPPSTLRIYSVKLGVALSSSARGAGGQRGVRVYTGADLERLSRAKRLLARGKTYAEVVEELARDGSGGLANSLRAVPTVINGEGVEESLAETVTKALSVAGAWERIAAERLEEVSALKTRVEALEAEVRVLREKKGWWRRLLALV